MPEYKIKRQVCFGRDPVTGKRIRKWVYGNKESEVNRRIREIEKELESVRNPSDATFRTYSEQWLETYKAHKSVNTYKMYDSVIKKCSDLNGYQIREITHSQLQAVISRNIEHARLCQQIRLTLQQIFKTAVRDGIIASNPAEDLELPHYKAAEKRALTEAERKIIRTVKLPERERAFLDVLYYFGLRRGEALALTRSDFDFKTLLLTVNKSIAFDGNDSITKDTKTHVARYVPIPKQIQKRMKAYVAFCGFRLFANADGTQMTRSGFRTMWERIADAVNKAAGGTDDLKVFKISPHMLRHDYATRLYYVPGISTKKKADILGHQEQLFLRLYSHLDDEKEDLDTFRKLMNF